MSKAKELIEKLGNMPEFEPIEEEGVYSHSTVDRTTHVYHNDHKIGEVVHRGGDKHIATVFNSGNKVRKNKVVGSKQEGVDFIRKHNEKNGAHSASIG